MKRRSVFCTIISLFCQLWLRIFARESVLENIINDQEDLKDDWKTLVWDMEKRDSENHKINIVLSSSRCSICPRVLGIFMNESRHSFLTVSTDLENNLIAENDTNFNPDVGYYKFVVILTKKSEEFFDHFVILRKHFSWNPRARHLIFTVEKPGESELETIFAELWNRQVLNAVLIVYNSDEAFTYNPYLRKPLEMVERVNWSHMFYDKLQNMNGYRIRTKFIPYSVDDHAMWVPETGRYKILGSNFGLSEAFFYSVNATPEYINLEPDEIIGYKNFTYRCTQWNERSFENFELWLNTMQLDMIFHERIETGYPLRWNNLFILVPKSGIRTPSIFRIYDNITWICIAASLLTFAFYSHFFYKLRNITDNALLRTFGIFLGKNLAPRHHGLLEKSTFLVLTISSLLILSAYQGELYTALATETYYPEIDTLHDFYMKIKTVRTYQIIAEYFRSSVKSGVEVIEFRGGDMVNVMRTHRDEAFAFPSIIAHYMVRWKIFSEDGMPMYHVMKDYVLPGFEIQIFPYGSPYLEKMEEINRACQEAGLQQYWDSEAHYHALLTGIIIPNVTERSPKKLSLNTQLTAFYILGAGLLLSIFCYALEICYHKNLKKKRRSKS